MKFLTWMKDGGPESKSSGLFFVEIKNLFTIVLLHFSDGSRDAYHNHAFNSLSWVLRGRLEEYLLQCSLSNSYTPSLLPVLTRRTTFHKVVSIGDTWAISFRGPWTYTWTEWLPTEQKFITLTHGRRIIYETNPK